MTYDQILEELKKLKMHTDNSVGKYDLDVNIEVEEINETIESYNEKIAALEAKLADESNYQYNNENEERDLTIELLEESFENQLEVIAREDAEYKNLQDLATSIFTDYNLEIATLNTEIAAIERRLRKNDIAVRKNIGIKLTDDELFVLNSELEQKRARIQKCEEMKVEYVEELRNYGELITANNRKREIVLSKQESLNKIKEHRASKVDSIDHAKLHNDKDELASLKAGVAALESRKDYITYNPNAEIDKLISAIEQNKINENSVVEENKELNVDNLMPSIDEVQAKEDIEDKSQALINAYLAGNEEDEYEPEKTENIIEEEKTEDILDDKEKDLINDDLNENEEFEEKTEEALGIPEETTAHDMWLAENSDLDLEREAEIEEASEILKEKKKEGWFKKNWKKWVAVGLATIAIVVAIKSCNSNTKNPNDNLPNNNNISQSQEDDNNKDDDFNDKYEIPDNGDLNNNINNNNSNNNNGQENDSDNLENNNQQNPIVPEVEPEVKTSEVELEAGESMTSIQNILNGNINEDTVIEHGDEVGKTIENAELKNYTEEGNAVVEFEKNEEKPGTSTSREDIIKNLEEFMGGDLTFTDEGNKWLDQVSGKTRR